MSPGGNVRDQYNPIMLQLYSVLDDCHKKAGSRVCGAGGAAGVGLSDIVK